MGKTRKDRLDCDERFYNRDNGKKREGTKGRGRSNDLNKFRNTSTDEVLNNIDEFDELEGVDFEY